MLLRNIWVFQVLMIKKNCFASFCDKEEDFEMIQNFDLHEVGTSCSNKFISDKMMDSENGILSDKRLHCQPEKKPQLPSCWFHTLDNVLGQWCG